MKQRNEGTSGKQTTKRAAARGEQENPGGMNMGYGVERRDFSPDEQRRLIAEAAYFRALERGFAPGCEMDDWLQAEAEINQILQMPNTQPL